MSERAATHPFSDDLRILKRFWPYARPYRRTVITAALSIPLVSTLGLVPPFLMMHGIDVNLSGHDAHPILARATEALGSTTLLEVGSRGLLATVILFFVAIVLEYVGRSVQTFALQAAGHRSVGGLRREIYRHVTGQSSAFFDRNPTGALLTRSTNDVESLAESLATGVVTIFADIFNLVAITGFMLVLSVKLTLVTFAIAPVLVIVVNFFRKKLKETFLLVRTSLSDVNAFMQEHLAGVRIVQLFNRETEVMARFEERNRKYLRATQTSNWYDASLYAMMEGMATLCVGGLLWYGGVGVYSGALTLGLLVAFLEYTQRVFVPIKEFSGKFAVLQQAVASMSRVVDLLDTHQEIAPGIRRLERATGDIRLEAVTFRYSEQGEEVLKGISLVVKPGQVVALVGATGSGKTTIGKLLTRMYQGYSGSILLEGQELRDLEPDSVREKIGVVQQDVLLFNGSIEFNISLGNPGIGREQVQAAARLVQADAFIQQLPGAYDFQVAERGANLSAGQAQLLAFARVMAHDPPIVVLDEATASVDSQTEALIQQAIAEIFKRKTVLVIAHRLSTIQAADQILVLQRGEIAERGTHESLLREDGLYAQLSRTGFGEG